MRQKLLSSVLPVVEALALLAVLLAWDPFRLTSQLAGRLGGAAREEALVKNVYQDPTTQETSKGEAPLGSLSQLSERWCKLPARQGFVLMGNSQTYTILLAPSERAGSTPERPYPDRILEDESSAGRPVRGYRLSAPNLSYPEVLWYLNYFLAHPCAAPERLIIQLNYESFRKLGIRPGMLELLSDPVFAARIASEANSPAAYSAALSQALSQYRELRAKTQARTADSGSGGRTGVAQTAALGNEFEIWVRGKLEALRVFRARADVKKDVLDTLYLLRVNVLGITPTTKRSLGGVALAASLSALERVGQLCLDNQIKLEFFVAPQNPRATLYRTDADRRLYEEITGRLARQYAWRFANLEESIPENMWGFWIDGPDPIHFGRAAHERMAQLIIASGLVPDDRS
jgi:hypothetical protein